MVDSIIAITLDLQETSSLVVVKAKKGDTGRILRISLSDGGTPYTIDADCYAVFSAKKPDGKQIANICTITDNVIEYAFTEQTCSAVGRMFPEIRLYGSDDTLITSASFVLEIHVTVMDEDSGSESEANVLDALILETAALRYDLQSRIENGEFQGKDDPPGPTGPQGEAGISAYDYAKLGGYRGTQEEFAKKLATEYLSLSGGEMEASINMKGHSIFGIGDPAGKTDAISKEYADKTYLPKEGAVSTVAGVSPDADGNVPLTATDVKALPIPGGTMEGPIDMNGQSLSGLNAPTADDEAATKGYVDTNKVDKANVVNNFTTTEEGFVADARALKVLNDRTLQNNTYVVEKNTYSGVGSIMINVSVKADGNEHKIPISIYGVDNNTPCFGCVSVILAPYGDLAVNGFIYELLNIDMAQIINKVLQCTGTVNDDSVTLTISGFDGYGRYIFSCHNYIIE